MRKICVYTSTRADYGLLRNLIREIQNSPVLTVQLLVSGGHLAADQGMTLSDIQKDGFEPDQCVDINVGDDTPRGICHSMGKAIAEYGAFFNARKPDIVVILGDRFEAFCCAAAAQVCTVPVAHIHGGETSQGAIDEAFRHSITKMAHLHFPSCEPYRRRIIQMGESPGSVHNVGSLGVENIRNLRFMDQKELAASLSFDLEKPFFLVTFHPVTLEGNTSQNQFSELLAALEQYPEYQLIFTGANADAGGRIINQMQENYRKKYPGRCLVMPSLGAERYLSAMKLCAAVVGNSSSGMIEAPALHVPTVNIGDRQKGRLRTPSIIDCRPEQKSILAALKKITDPGFPTSVTRLNILFDKPDTAKNIKKILEQADLNSIMKKQFYDIAYQVPSDQGMQVKK